MINKYKREGVIKTNKRELELSAELLNAIADLESADLIEVEPAETEEGTIPVFVLV